MPKVFEDMVGSLPWLLMGGMMFDEMQKYYNQSTNDLMINVASSGTFSVSDE